MDTPAPAAPMNLLSIEDVKRRTSLSRRTIERLLEQHRLPSVRVGRRRLIAEQDLLQLIAELRKSSC